MRYFKWKPRSPSLTESAHFEELKDCSDAVRDRTEKIKKDVKDVLRKCLSRHLNLYRNSSPCNSKAVQVIWSIADLDFDSGVFLFVPRLRFKKISKDRVGEVESFVQRLREHLRQI